MIVWKTVSNDYVQMILNGKPLFERANEKWGGEIQRKQIPHKVLFVNSGAMTY